MTAYGQSITPKWFLDRTPRSMSKFGMLRLLHQALITVGMLPIRRYLPTVLASGNTTYWVENNLQWMNLEDSLWNEFPSFAVRADIFVWYDFPSEETFEVNGVSYRPILLLHCPTRSDQASDQGDAAADIFFSFGYRRADRILRSDFTPWTRVYQSAVGYGAYSQAFTALPNHEGMKIRLWNWKHHAALVNATYTQMVGIRNVHVILGKGGLFIQVGSGVGKTDSNDILSCGFMFGGARLPGRARIPLDDVNLAKINPVLPVAFHTVNGAYFYDTSFATDDLTLTGQRLKSYVMGMQHDLKPTLNGVVAQMFNIENIERPIMPVGSLDTKESPRDVNGLGAHVLQRIVYLAWNELSTTSYFGPIRSGIRAQPTPAWEDTWTFPCVRAADRTAPYGEYIDPLTNTNWFLFRAANVNAMLAIEVEGILKLSSSITTADTEMLDQHLTLINGDAGPVGLGFTVVRTGAALTYTPGVDEITWTGIGNDSTQNFVLSSPTALDGDPRTYQYEVTFEGYNRGTVGTVQSVNGTEAVVLEYSTDGGSSWVTVAHVPQAGTNAANSGYNYATYRAPIRPGDLTTEVRFRIRLAYGGTTFGNHSGGVRNIRFKKIRRE